MFTVVHMENNRMYISKNTRINSVFHVLTTVTPRLLHPVYNWVETS